MFLVDTNVFLCAVNDTVPEHAVCRSLVDRWRSERSGWYTTWSVLYEFLRVATHVRVFPHPLSTAQGAALVRNFIDESGLVALTSTPRHPELLERSLREAHGVRGSAMHDLHVAVLMREHGIRRIVTRDTGFHRFPWLEVVDPLRAAPK